MYFVDHTGSRWPVNASTVTWNQSSRLGVYYQTPGNCPFHCVHVYSGNYGAGDYGVASVVWDANGHLVNGASGTTVYLNNYYSAASTRDRHTTCQELGHGLGLAHQGLGSTSCMNNNVLNTQYPNDHDWNMIYELYDH